jgi:hypothetical protein
MRDKSKKKLVISFVCIFVLFFSILSIAGFYTGNAEKRVKKLDKAIVKAYNAEPKKTEKIYHYCMELIECCSSSNVNDGDEWISKARKVITLACANEVATAVEQRRYKEAYGWVTKGLENGAGKGVENGYDIEKMYAYLKETKRNLEDHFEEYNIQYKKTGYSYTTSRNKHLSNKLFNKR